MKNLKIKKIISMCIALAMILTMLPAVYASNTKTELMNVALGKEVKVYDTTGALTKTLTGYTDGNKSGNMTNDTNTLPAESYGVIDLGKPVDIETIKLTATGTDWHSQGLNVYASNDISGILSGNANLSGSAKLIKTLVYAESTNYDTWYQQYDFAVGGTYQYLIMDTVAKQSVAYFGEIYVNGNVVLTNAALGKEVKVYDTTGAIAKTITTYTDGVRIGDMTSADNTLPGNSYGVIDLGRQVDIKSINLTATGTDWHSAGLNVYATNDISGITSGNANLSNSAKLIKTLNYADTTETDSWYRLYDYDVNGKYQYLILDTVAKVSYAYFGELYVYEEKEIKPLQNLLLNNDGTVIEGVTVSCNSDTMKGEYKNILDGNIDTWWFANTLPDSAPTYFVVDLGRMAKIGEIEYLPSNSWNANKEGEADNGGYFRNGFDVQLSKTGNFDDAKTVISVDYNTTLALGESKKVELNPEENVYRYIRVCKPYGGYIGANDIWVKGLEIEKEPAKSLLLNADGSVIDGVTVSCNSTTMYGSYSNILDGDVDTWWFANTLPDSAPTYFVVDLGRFAKISEIEHLPSNSWNANKEGEVDNGDYFRCGFDIQLSKTADFANPNTVASVSYGTPLAIGESKKATLKPEENVYRYVRVYMPYGGYIGANDIWVKGYELTEDDYSSVSVESVSHSTPDAITNVKTSELIEIKFNGAIDTTTANSDSVCVYDADGNKTAVNPIVIDNTTVGIYPGELKPLKTYTVAVSGVCDAEGDLLAPFESENTFTTDDTLASADYVAGKMPVNVALNKEVKIYDATGALTKTITTYTDGIRIGSILGDSNTMPGNCYTVVDLGKQTEIASIGISTSATEYHSNGLVIYGTNDITSITSGNANLSENATLIKSISYADTYDVENWYKQYNYKASGTYQYIVIESVTKISTSYLGEIYVYEQKAPEGDLTISGAPAEDGTMSLKIENDTYADVINKRLLVAVYEDGGRMLDVADAGEVTVISGTEWETEENIAFETSAWDYAKIFLWNGLDGLLPMIEDVTVSR